MYGLKEQRGFVLLTVVVLTWFLFALVGTYFILINVERAALFQSQNSLKAEAIAEAGIEEVAWEYNYDGSDFSGWSISGTTATKTQTYADASGTAIGSYTVTVENYPNLLVTPRPLVTVVATYNAPGINVIATVKAQFKPRPLFPYAMFAKDRIVFTGNAFTNSYDSALGSYNADLGGGNFNLFLNGDVRTNLKNTASAINLSAANGNPVIGGDAIVGTGSTVSHPAKVSGSVSASPPKVIKDVSIPSDMLLLISLGTLSSTLPGIPLPGGDYKFDEIDVGGANTVEIGLLAGDVVRIWTTGEVGIGGSGEIRVNPGVTLIIYTEGDVNIGGDGIANLSGTEFPQRLQIFATPTCDDLNVTGGPDFIAVLKAPQADIDLAGTPAIYGAYIGDRITATGGGGVHFDEQLLNPTSPTLMDGMEIDWLRRLP